MKIRINEEGMLQRYINGKWKDMKCPRIYTTKDEDTLMLMTCGDWCALFGEPEEVFDAGFKLAICEKVFGMVAEDFEDLRGKKNEKYS
jgi:hypothetical protein